MYQIICFVKSCKPSATPINLKNIILAAFLVKLIGLSVVFGGHDFSEIPGAVPFDRQNSWNLQSSVICVAVVEEGFFKQVGSFGAGVLIAGVFGVFFNRRQRRVPVQRKGITEDQRDIKTIIEDQSKLVSQQLFMTQVSIDKAAFDIYWITEDSSFFYVNDQACLSLGYTKEQLEKLRVSDIDPNYDDDVKWAEHWRDIKEKGAITFRTEHIRADGTIFPVQVVVNFLEYEGVGYNIAYAIDISDRVNAEKLSREHQEQYKRLFNEMTSGAALHEIICDSNGKPVDYRFLDINPAFEELTGLAAGNVIGKRVLEVLPETEPEWIEKYGEVALTGKSIFFESFSAELNRHYEVTAYSPGPNLFAVTFHDVTRRKIFEAEREELLRTLEDKNAELQSVFYTVSHDLKSPLVNISGFSGVLDQAVENLEELLNEDLSLEEFKTAAEGIFNEDIRDSVKFIVSSSTKMKELLDGLLAVSRIGTKEIAIQRLNMQDHILSVLDSMKFQLDENQVDLEVGHLPDCIGDAGQIDQVFTNVLDNAMKYRDRQRQCKIKIYGKEEKGKAVYYIEDNGVGIPENHQSKIFEIFHRLNPNDGIEGQGIGLTIIKRILHRQNGEIKVESEPGVGTKFRIELPA